MAKLTFSLDEQTVQRLRTLAERQGKPQSLVVREAIAHYAAREETLDDEERERLLDVLRTVGRRPPTRAQAQVDRELRDIRRSRAGWSRPVR